MTEFMASNSSALLDGNGAASDWIEIFNKGDQSVNLAGYTLTDDPQTLEKWTFPNTVLDPGKYVVVFASGNGVADPAGNLHTNFSLSAAGEYVALVNPSGAVLSQFGTSSQNYPAQSTDVSYGLAFSQSSTVGVGPSSTAKRLIPTNNSVDTTWMNLGFNDAAWASGTASIGYETSPSTYAVLIQTTVPTGTTSVYVRIPFTVSTAGTFLTNLQMKYDDGFIAYLNGERIASANVPATGLFNSTATDTHANSLAVQYVNFDVSSFSHLLNVGSNVLAIHMLNRTSGSSDLLSVPHLPLSTGASDRAHGGRIHAIAYPRTANTQVQAGGSTFRAGGAFTTSFQLTLTPDDPTATIRYTTTGSLPQATSPLYAGPITVSNTVRVALEAFGTLGQVGTISSEAYSLTATTTGNFTSDLPIVVIENFGQGRPGDAYQAAWLSLYDVQAGTGRSGLANEASFTTIIGQHDRGSSMGNALKQNLRIELRNDLGVDQASALLGMPSEADWILYAPYNFDRATMRNTTFYELFRQMGRYTARTRFVEVYTNLTDGVLNESDYQGVYVLMENIKVDANRVDIAELTPQQNQAPDITGGYILRLDRTDGTPDAAWHTTRGIPTLGDSLLVHDEPERTVLTIAQRDYIRDYVQDFEDCAVRPEFDRSAAWL